MKHAYLIVMEQNIREETEATVRYLVKLLGEGWTIKDTTATNNSVHYILTKEDNGKTK